jgi:hypothetical protein
MAVEIEEDEPLTRWENVWAAVDQYEYSPDSHIRRANGLQVFGTRSKNAAST